MLLKDFENFLNETKGTKFTNEWKNMSSALFKFRGKIFVVTAVDGFGGGSISISFTVSSDIRQALSDKYLDRFCNKFKNVRPVRSEFGFGISVDRSIHSSVNSETNSRVFEEMLDTISRMSEKFLLGTVKKYVLLSKDQLCMS